MRFTLLKASARRAALTLALTVGAGFTSYAQSPDGHFGCGTMPNWEEQMRKDAQLKQVYQQFESMLDNARPRSKREDTAVRIIPVVFHVMHTYGPENISKSRIEEQIRTLNTAFRARNADTSGVNPIFKSLIADCRIEFRLAHKDPNGNCTDGITRRMTNETENARDNIKAYDLWDPTKYLNVWVVSSIDNFGGAGTVLGYAQFPWFGANNTDGIVMRADQVMSGNRTLTHEVGHYLGLFHTFETAVGSNCNAGTNCATTGDRICDTPPAAAANFGCPKVNSCAGDNPDVPDMVENYMDYSSCSRMFSLGQKTRMTEVLNNSKRSSLWTAENLEATGTDDAGQLVQYCKPKADFFLQTYVVCAGSQLELTDNSYNSAVTGYEWTFTGGTPATSSDKNPKVSFSQPGTYGVKLKVSNPAGTDEVERDAIITVLPAVSDLKAPFLQDFEHYTPDLKSIVANQDDLGMGWEVRDDVGFSGKKSWYLNNYNGQQDFTYHFDLPTIDMTATKNYKLSFRTAYRKKELTTNDELRVSVSSNCGQYYQIVYFRSGSGVAKNTTPLAEELMPTADDWRTDEVDLAGYRTVKNLMIRFSIKNKGGNNVYMDDINVGGALTSIADGGVSASLNVYPNPASGTVNVELPESATGTLQLNVTDLAGRTVQQIGGIQNKGGQTLTFSREALNISGEGVYFLSLRSGAATYICKLVIVEP